MYKIKNLKSSRDLSCSDWGPYTKKYMGVSHIADKDKGFRFDVSVFPGYYRRRIDVPNVRWETGYHPWEASPDLNTFSVRHELEWKDKVYCDITYSRITDDLRLMRCEFVNNSDAKQNAVLHTMASMNFPTHRHSSNIKPSQVSLPTGCSWLDALDYISLDYSKEKHSRHLVYDGMQLGEERKDGFVSARCLGKDFGKVAGDTVTYNIEADQVSLLRYKMDIGDEVSLLLKGDKENLVTLVGTGQIENYPLEIETLKSKQLIITSQGGSSLQLDGLVLGALNDVQSAIFNLQGYNAVPCITKEDNNIILKYEDVPQHYGIRWFYDDYEIREIYGDELDSLMRFTVNNHVSSKFHGEGEGHYTNIFMRPIFIEAQERITLYGLVTQGDSKEEVRSNLQSLSSLEEVKARVCEDKLFINSTEAGEEYTFSQQRMRATMLTNTVYPVYVESGYIKHNTPGRWWDSLYTWDSGFIGIGFCDLDLTRAIECLNTYVTDPEDDQRAFIHHGTPLAVQIYQMMEIWNRKQDKDLLTYFYPKLKHFYDFIVCKDGVSTTDIFDSNLLQTWQYFYNSGGWDDYPPQHHLFNEDREKVKHITPVVTSAHAIRCAKILSMMADELGVEEDKVQYNEDIRRLGTALQEHAWDKEAGYFSYVLHDDAGQPKNFYTYKGENFNKGLDGVAPLTAGICNKEQRSQLLSHLMSEQELWTPIGLSTVDQSAGYYKKDGYWNGAVWMPHQWFVWKTMLDLGEGDFAYKIANTALDLWKNEVEESYHCFEHFIIKSGRGAGWHQFGGLSSPVVNWFASYYVLGSLTTGFNSWIISKDTNEDTTLLEASIKISEIEDAVTNIIAVMNPHYDYDVLWNDEPIIYKQRHKGTLEVQVAAYNHVNNLTIKKK